MGLRAAGLNEITITQIHSDGNAGSTRMDFLHSLVFIMGKSMIEITKLNGQKVLINPSLIEMVEETPDTVISLTTGRKIIVKESRQDIKNLVKSYRKDIFLQ